MERKGLMAGAVVLVLLALGLGIWVNQAEQAGARGGTSDEEPGARDGRTGIASASPLGRHADGEPGVRDARRRALVDDGGVPRAAIPPALPGDGRREVPPAPAPELQHGAADADRSAGWRLGQTRHRIAIVEPRIARMRELVAGFEQRGETAAAQQQRTIMQRFENRLAELRTEETDLLAQAQQDGTIGEAEQGLRDSTGAQGPERPPIPAVPPPSVP